MSIVSLEKKRARSWTFTLNNFTDNEIKQIKDLDCKTLVFQGEIGEETGTPHLQGFIMFRNARYFSAMKNLIHRWHVEPCATNVTRAVDYAQKRNSWDGLLRYSKINGSIKINIDGGHDSVNNSYTETAIVKRKATIAEAMLWGKENNEIIKAGCDLFAWKYNGHCDDYPGTEELFERKLAEKINEKRLRDLDTEGEFDTPDEEPEASMWDRVDVLAGWQQYDIW